MTVVQFEEWPKTTRLFRDCIITEKLDGTNACVIFKKLDMKNPNGSIGAIRVFARDGSYYGLFAQSRKRLITPESDNYGFATWALANHEELWYILGEGRHFGEWWGQGIQRKYDMPQKVFSLFNTTKWFAPVAADPGDSPVQRALEMNICVDVVPTLEQCKFDSGRIRSVGNLLFETGSMATEKYTGKIFDRPEGICVYHTASGAVFKYTFDNNDQGKWQWSSPSPE